LRESEARFRRLSDASRDGIAVITDGRVSDVNYAFTRLFGWDELEAHGLPAEMLWEGGHRERVARYLAGGLDGSIEVPGRRKQGGMFDLEISATQVTVEGRVAQVLVLRDISGRKEVDRMKRDFIATVSHELRTPLTSIRGSLGLVQGAVAGRIDAQATRLLAIALDNAERLTRLVNDILDLEKIEAGKLALTLAQVRMGDLVHAASEGVRPLATAQQVEIRVHPVGELRAVGDRDRLLQVLTNYLSNAIRFSPVGSTVTVRVEVADAGTVRCAVEDRGPGISAVDIPRLFQRFTQLDNARDTKVQGGTGLGLAISRSIVEQHRGRVGVESTIGVGTVFWFEIPAVVSTITDEQRGAGVTSLPHPKPS
jgi:PAS domain S-box-containing protein